MESKTKAPRSWYKKKRYIIVSVILGIIVIANLGGNSTASSQIDSQITTPATPVVSQQTVDQVAPYHASVVPTDSSNLSNSNYYTNTYGNQVHSPAYSNTVPVGASAQCGDGTYSFSQSRRGTCSHHGGVATWL